MKRRGLKVFLVYIILSFCFREKSFTAESNEKFLQLPFASDVRVLQGWVYTVKVNGSLKHEAMDYDCEPGERIYASSDGIAMSSRQISAVSQAGYGNFIFIKHNNGYSTLYGHLSKLSDKVKVFSDDQRGNTDYSEWTPIKKGDYIGDCGMSGADNVHLHFEVTTGKYATGRVDSYDLYKTKEFYPPNALYTAMGPKHLWATVPPSYIDTGIAKNSAIDVGKSGVWDIIKGLVASNQEVNAVKVEQENKPEENNEVLGLSFVDKKIDISPKLQEDKKVVIHAQNTGTKVWKRNEISLNVIGGASANSIFQHTSWISGLRPTLLDTSEVKPGESGTFTFIIKGLSPGSYTFKLMAVEVGTWTQIGSEQSVINISIVEPVEEKVIAIEPLSNLSKPLEGIVRGIKDFADSVINKVTDVIKSIPNFFGGGGGGSPQPTEDNNPTMDSSVHDPTPQPEESTIPELSDEPKVVTEGNKEILFNEIAWPGSSQFCPDHEWIELYNTSNTARSLDDWTIDLYTGVTTQTIHIVGSIDGRGYYLISHPNTFVSVVTPDVLMPQNIQLSDTGARLVLKNQDGETIDEVDQGQGWFGGNTGQFPHTLERVSPSMPSAASSSWKTSDTVRYGISSGNCGQITGSPRMANSGYVYISDDTLGFYTRNSNGEMILSKDENPYLFSNTTIHQREKMIMNPGTILAGISSDAQINVQGELMINGTESDPVILTSRNDSDHVNSSVLWNSVFTSQQPRAGDWQNISLSNTGKLTINHGLLRYGGNRYGTSVSCQVCARSQVISNQGGAVSLSDVEISDGYELGTSGKPDSLIYSEGGALTLENIKLHHGKRALHSDGNTEVRATSLTLHDFDLADKVLYFQERMPSVWESIVFTGNSPTYAFSPTLTVTSSYIIGKNTQFQFSTISVSSSGTLNINGGNVYATEIKIDGKLNVAGGDTGSEIAGGPSPSTTFSLISFTPGSSGLLSNVRIRGGGYTSSFPFTSTRPYMLWIDGASVDISNSNLTDARRPGGIAVVRNGNLTIKDSEIGWYSGYNKLSSFIDYGLVFNTQSTGRIENVNFRKMDYVIELNQGSTTTYSRMTKDNFIDLYKPDINQKNWFPQNLFPFQLW